MLPLGGRVTQICEYRDAAITGGQPRVCLSCQVKNQVSWILIHTEFFNVTFQFPKSVIHSTSALFQELTTVISGYSLIRVLSHTVIGNI